MLLGDISHLAVNSEKKHRANIIINYLGKFKIGICLQLTLTNFGRQESTTPAAVLSSLIYIEMFHSKTDS